MALTEITPRTAAREQWLEGLHGWAQLTFGGLLAVSGVVFVLLAGDPDRVDLEQFDADAAVWHADVWAGGSRSEVFGDTTLKLCLWKARQLVSTGAAAGPDGHVTCTHRRTGQMVERRPGQRWWPRLFAFVPEV